MTVRKKPTAKKVRPCSIDLVENDPVDIRCGGPRWLGFDFSLDASIPKAKWLKIIEAALKARGFNAQRIVIDRPTWALNRPWTQARVEKEIKNYSL